MTFRRHSNACLAAVAIAALVTAWCGPATAQQKPALKVGADAIGGQVTGPNGPEAGVWVIAETTDLPTKYAKMVATNDNGQYLIPQLPSAKYKVWVRGYGLVDSDKQDAAPGKTLDLKAKAAPNAAAAAEYYPGMYWYSMIKIPPASEFPGSDKSPTGMPASMDSQATWIDSLKNSCQSCHALGSDNIRHPHVKELGEFKSSEEMWERRVQSGQAMNNMALTLGRMGPPRAYKMFADWTDRVAAGELPFDKPERPKGIERNVVITSWEWGKRGMYLHDEVSTDKRNPTVNANGKIYGSPEESSDDIPVLDPVKNTTSFIHEPYVDPQTPSAKDDPMAPSPFWGEEAIWDGHTSIHNPMMDEKGRVWFTARLRRTPNPASCQAGSDLPSAQIAPLKESAREASMYDPKTEKWTTIDTCFNTHHLVFTPDNKLWFSQGQPYSGVVGWLDVKKFEQTGDAMKSQGWTPTVVNVSGTGKREDFVAPDKPIEPGKDKWVKAAFYGVMPSVKGDVIWGQAMGPGFSRIAQPALLIRMIPGSDPTKTAVSEIFQSPPGTYGSRGVDVDSKGVAWTVLSSGQLASFDRSKCKEKLQGPNAATGAQCFEGWTLYRMPGPQFKGVDDPKGSANHAYYIWVDVHNTLGLGNDVPIAMANGSESMLALVNGKFVDLRIPYPLGFFAKNADGRIDDPKAGWKGRGLWTTTGTRAYFHSEGGKDARPRVFKLQMRPDPLAG
ncbi:MAG TPA: carboxypeptidase-like regulatory domain-containing protein [Bradyrhizobium sp.]|uniref:carboxypeptidase-like regulatory domain-containing protein n=1 Tax=Bradyrhizobium sp. TaxID=376 RepID=UPI002D7EA05D|nr:carboxypeptidase-like regulatory domain-containing protein [Bradyrhizobium sp.]HET7884724.1 carboxypeptidase-like regulatory domain-containing protein [Bradyrhizobium sp.]